jgi:hypothetical protein
MSKRRHDPVAFNSLCRSVGHQWRCGSSPTYRRCEREGCRAAERLVGQDWIEASYRHKKVSPASLDEEPPPALWQKSILFDLSTLPYPGYDRQVEHAAFQHYYNLLSGKKG